MMRNYLITICLSFSLSINAQWTEWIPVHPAIQVSFKYGNSAMEYSWVRFRSVSPKEFCQGRVEFTVYDDGKYQTKGFTIGRIKPMEIIESRGNYFYTAKTASDIRLTKLTDAKCNDVLSSSSAQTGVSEMSFPAKKPTQQQQKQQAEEAETERRLKAWQDQERRKRDEIDRQNEAAARLREQQYKKQQEETIRRNDRDEATRRKIKEQQEARQRSNDAITGAINETRDIILNSIKDAEREREERKRQVEAELERSRIASPAKTESIAPPPVQKPQERQLVPNLLSKELLAQYLNNISPGRSKAKIKETEGILSWEVDISEPKSLLYEIQLGNIDIDAIVFKDYGDDNNTIELKGLPGKPVLKGSFVGETGYDLMDDVKIHFKRSLLVAIQGGFQPLVDIEYTLKYYAIKYRGKNY